MKRFHFASLIAVAVLAVSMWSCSERAELLDTIPADVQAVGMIDMKSLCKEAGITLSETGADMSPALKEHLRTSDEMTGLLDLMGRLDATGAADISSTAALMDESSLILTLPVDDKSAFDAIECPWLTWGKDAEGFRTGTLGDEMGIVANDLQMWLIEGNPSPVGNVKTVKELLSRSKKGSIGSIDAVADALMHGGNLISLLIPADNPGTGKGKTDDRSALLETPWTSIGVKAGDGRLTTDVLFMKGTGEEIPFKGLQPVNPAVLAYVPGTFSLALAAGVTPEMDWSVLTGLAALAGGFQAQAALAVMTPYLESIDGTVLIAAGPANDMAYSDPDPSNWGFLMMARLSQQKVDQLLGTIRTMMFSAGVSPRVEKDGTMVIPQYGTNLYVGAVDGYFAVSTMPFSPTRQNSLAPVMEGKEIGLTFAIPSLSAVGEGAPSWGLDVKAQFAGSKGRVTLTLPGSEGSVIANLLTLL